MTAVSLTHEDYARAARFLPWHAEKRIFRASVKPNWIADTDRFWYCVATRQGKEFVLVDAALGTRQPAFDHARLAAALTGATGAQYQAGTLPFDELTYVEDGDTIEFEIGGDTWRCNLNGYECHKVELQRGEYELTSPDGRWVAYARDHNLLVRNMLSGEETTLTHDGSTGQSYGTPLLSPLLAAGLAKPDYAQYPLVKLFPAALWSPDSRRILSHRIDERDAGQFTLVQSVPLDGSTRPRHYTYAYALPGDEHVPTGELILFDVERRTSIPVQIPPLNVLYYGTPLRRDPGQMHNKYIWWSADGTRLYVLHRARGFRAITFYEVDTATGAARVLVEEADEVAIDPHLTHAGNPNIRVIDNGASVIWFSQRSGWGHLYLYDAASGALRRQITSGEWAVADIMHIDEVDRWIYFTAVGREPGRDPYCELLYRVALDGGEPQLLTPDEGSHLISISPTGRYFVDTWSKIDTVPVTALLRTDGTQLLTLETGDVTDLTETGWQFPERFHAKARDGITDVYGILIRPSTFDPARVYPVIDAIYAGPQTNQAPTSFAEIARGQAGFWQAQALAELGFIVVMIDGLGMPYRAKAYHDVSYKNLGDAGLPEHIAALRELVAHYPYLDLDRVGIYGHSAGGYASCHAIFAYPDFYKVCVSSAGNHDHRLDKASWVERYMGLPLGDHYREQANQSLAHNLKGKLLLIHGEMDENVHVSSTLVVVDALIKANKDFDLLIMPNRIHACGDDPYFIRKRWDYFVYHLAGAEPPHEYQIIKEREG